MKTVLIAGISIVNLALISYAIAIIAQTRKKMVTRKVLTFLTIGVILDITSTICMILGSEEGPVTLHGFIGYSSLAGMLTDTILTYRQAKLKGMNTLLSKKFVKASLAIYLYWVLAYLTGAIIIMVRHNS